MDMPHGIARAYGKILVSSFLCILSAVSACASSKSDPDTKLDQRLAAVASCAEQGTAVLKCPGVPLALMRIDSADRIQVDVNYLCTQQPPLEVVVESGLVISSHVHTPPLCAIEGWINPRALRLLTTLGAVVSVTLPNYALQNANH